jgi:hypothetical protein
MHACSHQTHSFAAHRCSPAESGSAVVSAAPAPDVLTACRPVVVVRPRPPPHDMMHMEHGAARVAGCLGTSWQPDETPMCGVHRWRAVGC